MSTRLLILTVALVLISGTSPAQEPTQPTKPGAKGFTLFTVHPQPGQPFGADPISSKLFPPDLIMGHQEELGVNDAQRTAILKEIEKTQSQVLPLQWQMQAAAEQLAKALEVPKIDESKALAQADRLMTMERDVKRTHLGMLIRIRNLLSDSQRAKLAELRVKSSP